MSVKDWLQVGAAGIVAVLGVSVVVAWRAERRETAQLQEQLKSAQQMLTEATARQSARNAALKQRVGQLQKTEKAVRTPEDVVKALPEVLPLPRPLVLEQTAGVGLAGGKGAPASRSSKVSLPIEDLKPLYDSAVACKECQAELSVSQANLKDEKVKSAALGRERDDALRAAKGGTVLRRVARAAKWFLIGAAAGAVAVKVKR
jgi:hypothetical protein